MTFGLLDQHGEVIWRKITTVNPVLSCEEFAITRAKLFLHLTNSYIALNMHAVSARSHKNKQKSAKLDLWGKLAASLENGLKQVRFCAHTHRRPTHDDAFDNLAGSYVGG